MARLYRSLRRQAYASQTHDDILNAARTLFDEQGYAATTMQSVAARANLSTATIYASFKTKRSILMAIVAEVEGLSAAADQPSTDEDASAAAQRRLSWIVTRVVDLCPPAMGARGIAWIAAHSEPEFASWLKQDESRRWHELHLVVEAWRAQGLLRPELTVSDATDILWSMTGPALFLAFVRESGWSLGRYVQWLVPTLGDALLISGESDGDGETI